MKTIVAFWVCLSLSFTGAFGQNLFVLGDDEGDGLLFYPRQVEEGPDGNIYVLDTGDAYIKVFSPEGQFLRRIGGEGEGPGEFLRADGSSFGISTDGNLFFAESMGGHRWITFMELSGDFNGVLTPGLEEAYGVRFARPLQDGGFLVHLTLYSTPHKTSDYFLYSDPQALLRLDAAGNAVSEIVRTEYFTEISSRGDGAASELPYYPVFAWVALGTGAVAFSDGTGTTLKVFDYDGGLVRKLETDLPEPEEVTKEDLDSWRKRREEYMMGSNPTWYNTFGRVVYKYEKSLYDKPNIGGMSATHDGNILVSGPWDSEKKERHYWLIDHDGTTLAEVNIDGWALRVSERLLLYLKSDEDGNILVKCVERTGSEKADLLRIETLANAD